MCFENSATVKIEPSKFEDGTASLWSLQFLDSVISKLLQLLTDMFDRFWLENGLNYIYYVFRFTRI